MNRRLDTRVDSTLSGHGRTAERTKADPAKGRSKVVKKARSQHKPTRTKPLANAPEGVSMDYQMGFTSGFSV